MGVYVLPCLFLICAVLLGFFALRQKGTETKTKKYFMITTALLLFCFSMMSFLKYKNVIVIAVLIVIYYLANALLFNRGKQAAQVQKSTPKPKKQKQSK